MHKKKTIIFMGRYNEKKIKQNSTTLFGIMYTDGMRRVGGDYDWCRLKKEKCKP